MCRPTTPDLTELKVRALEAAANALVITDRKGRVVWHNPAFTRLTGYNSSEIVGRTLSLLQSGKQDQAFYRDMWKTILSGQSWHGELVNRRKDGSLYVDEQTITPVRGPDGDITHFIAIKHDVTERRKQQEQLEYLAAHDALTNLPNRRVLEEALERAIGRASRGVSSVLAFLDADNLKMINDSLGHAAGDKALEALARRLKSNLRAGDLLARVAGDEFVILLEGTGMKEAAALAARIQRSVSGIPLNLDDEPVYITVSIGLVPVTPEESGEELLSRADAAMYEAKQRGGNQIELGDTSASYLGSINAGFSFGQRVRKALKEQRLFFHYQPIVRLRDGRIGAYETLLRLREEDGQILSAGEFLRAAERGGFMNEIDRWVINKTLRVLEKHPDLSLCVNLSGHALNDERLMEWVMKKLADFGEGASRLGIEITETAVIHDLALARRSLQRLRTTVGRVSLDDFGAGFNSFAYLRHLSVDRLKIDGGLIRDVLHNRHHQAIVQAIHVLAKEFEVETVAEGIEDAETAKFLTEIGITHGQGYWFSKPLPVPQSLSNGPWVF